MGEHLVAENMHCEMHNRCMMYGSPVQALKHFWHHKKPWHMFYTVENYLSPTNRAEGPLWRPDKYVWFNTVLQYSVQYVNSMPKRSWINNVLPDTVHTYVKHAASVPSTAASVLYVQPPIKSLFVIHFGKRNTGTHFKNIDVKVSRCSLNCYHGNAVN